MSLASFFASFFPSFRSSHFPFAITLSLLQLSFPLSPSFRSSNFPSAITLSHSNDLSLSHISRQKLLPSRGEAPPHPLLFFSLFLVPFLIFFFLFLEQWKFSIEHKLFSLPSRTCFSFSYNSFFLNSMDSYSLSLKLS